jgi:serine protease Do
MRTPYREASMVSLSPVSFFRAWLALLLAVGSLVTARNAAAHPLSHAISDVAERVTPAVVNITTTRKVEGQQGFPNHPFFRGLPSPNQDRFERGAGSGVVVSSDGQIVTNNHVVEGADEIRVTFADKQEFEAKLTGADKSSDLAFLKIDAKGLPFLKMGDSSGLRLGEIVLAVGNPFGVGQTVTMGIVSAQGRASVGIIDYEDFIQTDAAINPGNSGGALVNLDGDLVGINTAILSRSGGAQGVGFAVPTKMIEPIRAQIMKEGRVRRGWLGVAIQDLTPELSRSLGVKTQSGVVVSDVLEGGPASASKLEPGDIVLSVNGSETTSAASLRNLIAMTRPNSKIELKIARKDRPMTLWVKLGEKQDEALAAGENAESDELIQGLAVRDIDESIRAQLNLPPRIQGVVVTRVVPVSAADRAGLEEGDVITSIGQAPIRSVSDFLKRVPKKATEILFRVFRRGASTFVVLKR